MNSLQYGFFDELVKIASVHDGTLAIGGQLVSYGDPTTPTMSGASFSRISQHERQQRRLADQQSAERTGAKVGRTLGTIGGAAAVPAYLLGSGTASSLGEASAPPMTASSGFAGRQLGNYVGRSVGKAVHRLGMGGRVLRANMYLRSRAARDAQGLGGKIRSFINPNRA